MPAIVVVQEDLSAYPPDSEAQQAAVLRVADHDAFNWLYDPVSLAERASSSSHPRLRHLHTACGCQQHAVARHGAAATPPAAARRVRQARLLRLSPWR